MRLAYLVTGVFMIVACLGAVLLRHAGTENIFLGWALALSGIGMLIAILARSRK